MKTKLLFAVTALLLSLASFSQALCGFDEVHNQKLRKDPLYKKALDENERSIQQYIAKNRSSITARTTGTNAVVYTIPVVVHVMHTGGSIGTTYNPTDAQIQGAIDYLNQVYNGTYPGTQGIGDLQIQFALAKRDPNCNTTSGIERIDASSVSGYSANGVSTNPGTTPGVDELLIKNLSRWNPYQYYNVWVVDKIDGKDGTSGTFTAGYAYFPGASLSYDGTIMLATQMMTGKKTLPHEIGHAFGLYHTFQGSSDRNTCPANANCNTDGDMVCDTDPETYNQLGGVIDFSCRTGVNSCTGTAYSTNTENNYMNYTNCYNLFTAGQKARMLASAASIYRKSLTTSLALSPIYPLAYSSPAAASCASTTSATGLSGGYAGIVNIELNNMNLTSSSAANDNGYVNGTNNCLNLIQLVKGTTYTFNATVWGANQEQLRAWIDFNNDGVFDNATEQIHFNSSITTGATTGSFPVPTNATLNTVLRMRVIDELSTAYGLSAISSGCFNPTYGQAEDYPVYITSGTLPVILSTFEGVLKNNVAVLSWKTATEQGLKSFDVEKSTDGIHFQKLGTIPAAGYTSLMHEYGFVDQNPAEANYYRLQMNDRNGATQASQVVLIRNNTVKQNVWVINNPFNSYIDLGLSGDGSRVELQLINTNGALMAEKTISTSSGQMRWQLPTSLSKGHYLLKAVVGGQMFAYKVVKQ
jgi:hypothetical protein